jgi:hypothetical protein
LEKVKAQNFGPDDSQVVSSLVHPARGFGKLGEFLQQQVSQAAGMPQNQDEGSMYSYGPSQEQQAGAANNLTGMMQTGAMPFAPRSAGGTLGTIGFRGLTKPSDPKLKSNVEWFSETPDLANVYAGTEPGANIIKKELGDVGKNSFDFGFRDLMTETGINEVKSRAKQGILDKFSSGSISKEKAQGLISDLDSINGEGYKRAHEWINKTDIGNILSNAGYEAISAKEQGFNTYGILGHVNKLPDTEFSRAHQAAQQHAALPVEQGGLGLPNDNTAMDRALALGFDTDAYHGTRIDFNEFQPKSWFADEPSYASNYSKTLMRNEPDNPTQQVIPALAKIEKPHNVNYFGNESDMNSVLSKKNKGAYVINNVGGGDSRHFVIKDPKNIRSRFAAFDPLKKDSANILASILAGTTLASAMGEKKRNKK